MLYALGKNCFLGLRQTDIVDLLLFLGTMCINKFVNTGEINIPDAQFCPTSGESGSSLMSLDKATGTYSAEGMLSFTKGCSKVRRQF